MSSDDRPPDWDDALAQRLIGALVIVGITRINPDGPHQEQMFGIVTAADRDAGIEVMLEGSRSGETYHLPPDVTAFDPAAPGEYRLRSTGEVVVDPDYVSSWTIHPPRN